MKKLYFIYYPLISISLFSSCITINVPAPVVHSNTSNNSGSGNGGATTPTPPREPKSPVVVYHGNNETVIKAVKAANVILEDPAFYQKIRVQDDFTHTAESPKDIAEEMEKFTGTVRVRLYHKEGTPTNAYFSPDYPNTVFLNSAKLDGSRQMPDIVNTIVHEFVHAVDGSLKNKKFGHGDDDATGKDKSAPYWIGALAECAHEGSLQNCSQENMKMKIKQFTENYVLIESVEVGEYSIID